MKSVAVSALDDVAPVVNSLANQVSALAVSVPPMVEPRSLNSVAGTSRDSSVSKVKRRRGWRGRVGYFCVERTSVDSVRNQRRQVDCSMIKLLKPPGLLFTGL